MLLRSASLFAICGLAGLLANVGPSNVMQESRTPQPEAVEKGLLAGTNAFRHEEGRGKLVEDPKLAATARDFAAFMARTDKYGHDADGRQPAERLQENGYEYCIVAENIAFQFNSEGFTTLELTEGLLKGWKNSPPHRKNMLDPDITEAGMGLAHSDKSDKYYAVQVFGRPKSALIEFSIANETRDSIEYTFDGQSFDLPTRTTRTHGSCRPGTLVFPWSKKDGKPEEFHPGKGDRFVIRKDGDQLKLSRKSGSQ